MKELHILERKLLFNLFARKHPPLGLLLVEVWNCVDFTYIRYASTGTLRFNILDEKCPWKNNLVVQDCVANEKDFGQLAATCRKSNQLEMLAVLESYRNLSHNKSSELSFGVGVMLSKSKTYVEVHGELITKDWFQYILSSAVTTNAAES